MTDARRQLPSVASLLEGDHVRELLAANPRTIVVEAVRQALSDARESSHSASALIDWDSRIRSNVDAARRPSLQPVFNATGVILHTNLGRAPLADAAVAAIVEIASGYTNLEYDLAEGRRGSRYGHCVSLLCELTGAEDAIVVNNCASALVLALSALARGRETIVSRGELIEIGGSFRVPDIMERSGTKLVEVGTTNRTYASDYREAITPATGAIAKIHRSNFAITGFVADANVRSLMPVADEYNVPVIHDLGSGLLLDLSEYGLSSEPTARTAIADGATLVLMSGDKLLGGPQAGIIVGSAGAVGRLRDDPFARAMRVDKLTIAALSATLALYRDPERALREIPTLAMISATTESIRVRCGVLAAELTARGAAALVVESTATVGAGAFPCQNIASAAVAVEGNAVRIEHALRMGAVPVIGRIRNHRLLLDMRTVPERSDAAFVRAVMRAVAE